MRRSKVPASLFFRIFSISISKISIHRCFLGLVRGHLRHFFYLAKFESQLFEDDLLQFDEVILCSIGSLLPISLTFQQADFIVIMEGPYAHVGDRESSPTRYIGFSSKGFRNRYKPYAKVRVKVR